ncbi:hypothetical protein K402DRAFT_334073, partial [Aulographum hederae CBS 113979]
LPGYSIKSYSSGETIPLFVNKIFSSSTQLQHAYASLPFVCAPSGRKPPGSRLMSGTSVALNLGEVLRGDRIMLSDYELLMGNDEETRDLCTKEVDRAGMRRAKELLREGYVAEWIVDNLPGATTFITTDKARKYYAAGFKMGYEELDPETGRQMYFINNHVTLVIRYHKAPGRAGEKEKKVIVGFEVFPRSLAAGHNETEGNDAPRMQLHAPLNATFTDLSTANATLTDLTDDDLDIDDGATLKIPYTYSVYFREEPKLDWANRWDMYFVHQEDSATTHWFAIANSLIICTVLASIVAVILARTIGRDLKGYSAVDEKSHPLKRLRTPKRNSNSSLDKHGLLDQLEDPSDSDSDADPSDEPLDDTAGWKLLHADVFRAPPFPQLLAPLIGSGTQLLSMTLSLLLLSALGLLNPSYRGGFVSVGFGLFVLGGLLAGYVSGRLFATFCGEADWRRNAVVTGLLVPGLLFGMMFVLNLFVWARASSTAIPFTTLVALLCLWLLIQLPLVYLGSYLATRFSGPIVAPVKTSSMPRPIPRRLWYLRTPALVLLGGVLPFAVIYVELVFVLRSLWMDKTGFYYLFGFAGVVAVVLCVVVVEVTVVVVYIVLCSENHKYHAPALLTASSSSLYIFLYSVYYHHTHLHITGLLSSFLFFAYSAMACAIYALLMASVGWLAAFWFVRRIYAGVKVD